LVRAEAETTLLGREVTPKPDAARLAAVRAAWTPVRAGLRPVEDLARTRQWRQAAEAFVKAMKEPGFDWPAVVSASEMAALEMAVAFLRAGDLEGHVKLSRIALAAARDSSSLPQVDRAAKGAVLSPRLPPDLVAEAARLVQSAESRSQEEYLAAWLKLARGMAEYRLGEYAQAIKSLSRVAASQENDAKPTALALRAMAAKRLAHDQEADQLLRQAESLRPAMARRLEANQANWPDLQIFDLVRDEARKLLGLPDQPK
jgi:tetratricopeptide (TPR) repeat protein